MVNTEKSPYFMVKANLRGLDRGRMNSVAIIPTGVVFQHTAQIGKDVYGLFFSFKEINEIKFNKKNKKRGEIKIKTDKKNVGVWEIPIKEGYHFVFTVKDLMKNPVDVGINIQDVEIYAGTMSEPYTEVGDISARADSSLFSKTATMDDVNYRLREEALKLGANTIMNVKYSRSSLTSWRGVKASGKAVFIVYEDKKCPFCAETVKKEAIKCKHCGSDLSHS